TCSRWRPAARNDGAPSPLPADGRSHPGHRFGDDLGTGGQVESYMARAAVPEDVSGGQGDPRLVEKEARRPRDVDRLSGSAGIVGVVKSQGPTVEPGEVGAFRRLPAHGGKMLRQQGSQERAVLVEAGEEGVEPRVAGREGGR